MAKNTPEIIDDIAGSEDTDAEIEAMEKDVATSEEEVTPEPETEAEPEPEPEKAEPEQVPLSALHESRQQTKDMRGELTKTQEKMTRMETLFEQMQQRSAGPDKGEEAPDIPKYDEDPDGYFQGTVAALQRKIDKLEVDNGQRQVAAATSANEQQLLERYASHVRTFTADTPDFQDAYSYLAKSVDEEMKARGISDPSRRAEAIQYEEGLLVGRAMQQGKDPADAIYSLAKYRGYKRAGKDAGETEDDKLERLTKGQEASTSLSGRGSSSSTAPKTLEALAAMDDGPEFDAAFEKAKRAGLLG